MRYIPLLLALVLLLSSGCATQMQIWANSDSDDTHKFSTRTPHYIHIGETVDFQITVEPDIASYVIMDFCGQRKFLKRIEPGRYSFTYTFGEKWRDRRCNIVVRAYKQNGRRDFGLRKGVLQRVQSSYDESDELLGQASMYLICYQSKVIIKFHTTNNKEPNWQTGRLYIYGPKGKKTLITYGSAGKDGFSGFGPELGSGKYILFYEPKYWQVHRAGQTKVLFKIKDPGTKRFITIEQLINTP